MLETVYIVRHGFRMNWHGNATFGSHLGRPRDPVLTAHGIDQAHELAAHLSSLPAHAQPQLILASPYYRTVQTALPTAQRLRMPIHLEPGLAEWFPPVEPAPADPEGTGGAHPFPPTRALLEPFFPPHTLAPTSAWPPVGYAHSKGEDVAQLHSRATLVLHRIERQCELLFPHVSRVLLVSHAATIIAMGRALVHRGPGAPWEQQGAQGEAQAHEQHGGYPVGAGTASLSQYDRRSSSSSSSSSSRRQKRRRRIGHLTDPDHAFVHTLNGSCAHLSHGVEREWNFGHLPHNVTERGMGTGWDDDQAPSQQELARLDAFWAEQDRLMQAELDQEEQEQEQEQEEDRSGPGRATPSSGTAKLGAASLSSAPAPAPASTLSSSSPVPPSASSSSAADKTRL
ncbi:hypothetical protein OC842_001368 [Tilletia horrida]|uniref:Transcription factor TFIIIC triple barrel domain-containing protein n=1 Tax=Tilletia horrida TaxID=155126 RepID=A0AAN6GGJ7_9BASI|nr:hypothetical protein OC842_001368 [Tilletia horrida]